MSPTLKVQLKPRPTEIFEIKDRMGSFRFLSFSEIFFSIWLKFRQRRSNNEPVFCCSGASVPGSVRPKFSVQTFFANFHPFPLRFNWSSADIKKFFNVNRRRLVKKKQKKDQMENFFDSTTTFLNFKFLKFLKKGSDLKLSLQQWSFPLCSSTIGWLNEAGVHTKPVPIGSMKLGN